MAKMSGAKRGRFLLHDPDPEVVRCADAIWKYGAGTFKAISLRSGVSDQTIAKVAYHETRWPRNETIDRIMEALGCKKGWTTPDGTMLPLGNWSDTMARSRGTL